MKKRLLPFGQVRAFDGRVVQLGIKQFPPQGVDRWYNIYDPRDPVALPAGGRAAGWGRGHRWRHVSLGGRAARLRRLHRRTTFARPTFQLVDSEAHSDRGYGECAQLAQLVRDFWIRWDPVSAAPPARG